MPVRIIKDNQSRGTFRRGFSGAERPAELWTDAEALEEVVGHHQDAQALELLARAAVHRRRSETDDIGERAAVANVASKAGSGWTNHLAPIQDLLATPDYSSGAQWATANLAEQGDPYFFSKECVVVYTMQRAHDLLERGIRVNCLSPGPVESPMMPSFREALGSSLLDWTAEQVGRMGRPDEMAGPLVFLNSDEASYVNGFDLMADGGFTGAISLGLVDFSTLPAS